MITLPGRINYLVGVCGSLRAVAAVTGLDVGYLSRLRSGEKSEPTKDTLAKLGLRKVVIYERIDPPPAVATELHPRTKSA